MMWTIWGVYNITQTGNYSGADFVIVFKNKNLKIECFCFYTSQMPKINQPS
jgi:hypothetical protein